MTTTSVSRLVEEWRVDRPADPYVIGDTFYLTAGDAVQARIPTGEERWRFAEFSDGIGAGTVHTSTEDVVYLTGSGSPESANYAQVVAVSRRTGDPLWWFETDADGKHLHVGGVALADASRVDDTLLVGSDAYGASSDQQPHVYGVDTKSGEERFRVTDLPSGHVTNFFKHAGMGYLSIIRAEIRTINPATGPGVGTVGGLKVVRHDPGVLVQDVFCLPGASGIEAYHLLDKKTVWRNDIAGISTPVVHRDGLLAVGNGAGYVHGIDAATGKSRWRKRLAGEVTDVVAGDGVVFASDRQGNVTALSRSDGSEVATVSGGSGRNDLELAAVGDTVVVGSGDRAVAYRLE